MDGVIFPGEAPFFDAHVVSNSDIQTRAFGAQLGKVLKKNSVICFFGDLGAGKTTFIKGLVEAVTAVSAEHVSSPTYTYLNIYDGIMPVYHFDLYRLGDADDFLQMGFDEYLTAGGICCIEWSERIRSILPEECLLLSLKAISMQERQIDLCSRSSK